MPLADEAGVSARMLRIAFETPYQSSYGGILPNRRIEAFTWRVAAQSHRESVVSLPHAKIGTTGTAEEEQRPVCFPEVDDVVACRVCDRYGLRPGVRLDGPAIIEERESAIVIGPAARARVDERLNVILEMWT